MATPIVSRSSCPVLQKYPYCSSMQLKRRMLLAARDLGEEESKQGWGMLDIEKLFASY